MYYTSYLAQNRINMEIILASLLAYNEDYCKIFMSTSMGKSRESAVLQNQCICTYYSADSTIVSIAL